MRLPETWREVRLDSICHINPILPIDGRPQPETIVSFVPMSAVDDVCGAIAKFETRTYFEVYKGYTSFKQGDVLFAKVTPCMENGKAAIVHKLENGLGFGSTEFHVLRPGPELLPEYLFHYIRQPIFRIRAASAFVGSGGLQRVPSDFLARFKFPLPTIPEQQRIVEVLSHAEALAFQQLLTIQKTEALTELAFIKMFGNPEPRINKRWPVVKLGDYVPVETGGTPSREVTGNFEGKIAWVKTTELKDSIITETEECISERALKSSNAKIHPVGTILLAMYGQGQTRGRTAKLAIPAACNQACAALLPCDGFNSDYLWAWLQLSYESVRGLGRGGQQANLNLSLVRGLKIPKPPLELQRQFSEQLKEIKQCKTEMRQSNIRFQELREGLTLVAVTGELTESWREDNIDLLRQETAKKPATHKKGRPFEATFSVIEHIRPHRKIDLQEPRRGWLIEQLSEFQNNVRWALYELKGTLVVDDLDALDRFCEQWPVENNAHLHDRVRRVLDQLASLGLIAKVAVRREDLDGAVSFLAGYRCFRDEERECQAKDVDRLVQLLSEVAE